MKQQIFSYVWPGQVHLGFGVAQMATSEAARLTRSESPRLFVLVDPGVRQVGLLDLLQLGEAQTVIFDQIVGNPNVASVDLAAAAFRDSAAEVIVGVGGGSALDTAKAVRQLAGGPPEASIADYFLALGNQARPMPHAHDLPPMIAIPTTAGTGSEVTPWGVITQTETHFKSGIGGPELLPNVALIDPELTLALPRFLTAATGMDALSHGIEAYVSTHNQPALDPLLLRAMRLISQNLPLVVEQPDNRAARANMMEAAMLAGIGISSNWLGACHSLAHPLSSLGPMHHGHACALMLPHQMRYSLSSAVERYAHIADALDPAGPAEASPLARAERAPELVHQLNLNLGLPTRLREAGVTADLLFPLSQAASRDLNWMTNPCPIDQKGMLQLYNEAY